MGGGTHLLISHKPSPVIIGIEKNSLSHQICRPPSDVHNACYSPQRHGWCAKNSSKKGHVIWSSGDPQKHNPTCRPNVNNLFETDRSQPEIIPLSFVATLTTCASALSITIRRQHTLGRKSSSIMYLIAKHPIQTSPNCQQAHTRTHERLPHFAPIARSEAFRMMSRR